MHVPRLLLIIAVCILRTIISEGQGTDRHGSDIKPRPVYEDNRLEIDPQQDVSITIPVLKRAKINITYHGLWGGTYVQMINKDDEKEMQVDNYTADHTDTIKAYDVQNLTGKPYVLLIKAFITGINIGKTRLNKSNAVQLQCECRKNVCGVCNRKICQSTEKYSNMDCSYYVIHYEDGGDCDYNDVVVEVLIYN